MMSNFTTALEERFVKQVEYLGKNKPVNNIEPVVSVTVATYQHAPYIKECLEGILMQKTDFPFEIIIGEDESTDGTREICIEYANKYPDKIRLFLRDRKQSQYYDETGKFIGRFNGHWNRMSARGKYIAWCEGDDYWINPFKLQKQIDFLESNPNYSFCFHNSLVIYDINNITPHLFNNILISRDILLTEIVDNWIIPTASIIFRKSILPLPEWATQIYSGDLLIALIGISKGKVYFIKDIMSIYRKSYNGSSLTSNLKNSSIYMWEQQIKLLNLYNIETNKKYSTILLNKTKQIEKEISFHKKRNINIMFAIINNPITTLKKILLKIKTIKKSQQR